MAERRLNRRWVVVAATVFGAGAALVGPLATSGAASPPTCVHPVNSSSKAQCTFDVWGYVTYQNGSPVAGADMTDHAGQNLSSDANGFYDFYELEPGTYYIEAHAPNQFGCYIQQFVDDNAAKALMNGGTRADLQLPCNPSSPSNPYTMTAVGS